jgi:hypothetical protein
MKEHQRRAFRPTPASSGVSVVAAALAFSA